MISTRKANSLFLSLAEKVAEVEDLDSLVVDSGITSYRMPTLKLFRSNGHPEIRVKKLLLQYPTFFDGATSSEILLFDSPENAAITIGRVIPDQDNAHFQLPRFHTGVSAQYDLEIAVTQMLAAPKLKYFLTRKKLEKELFVVSLIREGHLTFVQQAIFALTHKTVPLTLVHVHHVTDPAHSSDLNRLAEVCSINLEGLHPQDIKTLVISDNIASGIQVGVTLQSIVETIADAGGHLERVIIVAPLLTLYSAVTLAALLAQYQVQAHFLTCVGLLTHRDKERYYSPLTANPNLTVNPELMKLHHAAHPQSIRHQACVRCNWTASFLAPEQALVDSEAELHSLSSSNQEMMESQSRLSSKLLKKHLAELEPFSSRIQN